MEMDGTATSTLDANDVEVIVSDGGNENLYEPSIRNLAKKAERDGNLTPVVMNMEAQGADKPQIVNKVVDITISGELKKEMAMPCVMMEASGYTKTNAAAIGMKMVEMALNGNLGAIKEILNRTEGKVPNINKNANASLKMTGSIADLMAKIDANKDGQ